MVTRGTLTEVLKLCGVLSAVFYNNDGQLINVTSNLSFFSQIDQTRV